MTSACQTLRTDEGVNEAYVRFPNVAEKIGQFVTPGKGGGVLQVLQTAGIYGVVEMVMLLPGKPVRVLVRCLGGDLSLAEEVIGNREKQDALRVNEPEHVARAFGEHVEAEVGSTDEQRQRFEKHLQTSSKRLTNYDPAKSSECHYAFKDDCNNDLIRGALAVFGTGRAMGERGYAAILDDMDARGGLRTTSVLVESGFPVERILAPNREASVVAQLREAGAMSVQKHFREAMSSDFVGLNVTLAYLDSTRASEKSNVSIV